MALSFVVVYASGLYLLLFDALLREYGMLHWLILLAYLIVMAAVYSAYLLSKKRLFGLLLGAFGILMFIAQLADASLGLPGSKFAGSNGFSYLFGFGYTPLSSFGTSFAFVLFLIFNLLLFIVSARLYMRKRL